MVVISTLNLNIIVSTLATDKQMALEINIFVELIITLKLSEIDSLAKGSVAYSLLKHDDRKVTAIT